MADTTTLKPIDGCNLPAIAHTADMVSQATAMLLTAAAIGDLKTVAARAADLASYAHSLAAYAEDAATVRA